ncbi:MAG: hypothetical protein NZ809_04715 [Thermodesulfovibrio sp.]|nr:hypothetical protein [Thermodesulfovibrio sp.]
MKTISDKLIELRNLINACQICHRANIEYKNFPFKTTLEWIPRETKILFLAQDPPANQNYFYSNPESRFTQKLLKLLVSSELLKENQLEDFVKEGYYLTDAAKCSCGDQKNCKKFLIEEIDIIKPKIICTLGLQALKSLLKRQKLTLKKFVGRGVPSSILKNEFSSIYVFSCYFPTAMVKDEIKIRHFKILNGLLNKIS